MALRFALRSFRLEIQRPVRRSSFFPTLMESIALRICRLAIIKCSPTGYRADPKSGIVLSENQNATFDWPLQKQMVHWDEIPIIQGIDLFPEGPGKDKFEFSLETSIFGMSVL
jgi:hypothetical protein